MAALTCWLVQDGCACLTSAAVPAVMGGASVVPAPTSEPLPVPTPAEATLTPGAMTSGLGAESGLRGPPELNDAVCRYAVLGTSVGVRLVLPPSACSSFVTLAVVPAAPRKGIVTSSGSP